MNPIEEAIKEVALKHKILIKQDDPALVMATINEKLLAHYGARWLSDMVQELKAVGILIERNNENAKQIAGQTITKAGQFVHDQVIKATTHTGELLSKDVRAEGLVLQRDLELFRAKFVADVRSIQWLLFAMSLLTALFLGIFLGMFLLK